MTADQARGCLWIVVGAVALAALGATVAILEGMW